MYNMKKHTKKHKNQWNENLRKVSIITVVISVLSGINNCKKIISLPTLTISGNFIIATISGDFIIADLFFIYVLFLLIYADVHTKTDNITDKDVIDKINTYYENWCNAHLQIIDCITIFIAILANIIPKKGCNHFKALILLAILGGISIGSIWKFSRESNKVISFDKNILNRTLGKILIILWFIVLIFIIALTFNTNISFWIIVSIFFSSVITYYALSLYCLLNKKGIANYIEKHKNKDTDS